MNRYKPVTGFKSLFPDRPKEQKSLNTKSSTVTTTTTATATTTTNESSRLNKIIDLFETKKNDKRKDLQHDERENSADSESQENSSGISNNCDNDENEFPTTTTTITELPTPKNEEKTTFVVIYGKKTTKKHKTWDEDGTLEVSNRNAVLKDNDGKVIGRSRLKEDVSEGDELSVGSKELQIIERISSNAENKKENNKKAFEPPLKKMKTSVPIISKTFKSITGSTRLNESYEPLIMPEINPESFWEHDKKVSQQKVSVDACVAKVLRAHQRLGVVFLYRCVLGMNKENCYGAILADEMGLGKTLQCISLVWTLLRQGPEGKPVLKRILIIAPSSLTGNWDKEFIRWLGRHRVLPFVANAKRKPKEFAALARHPVLIISYEMFIRCFEEVKQICFDLIICDEGHRLKNNAAKAAQMLKELDCKRRILLTGTPIQNYLHEFYALIDLVNPNILGSYNEYKEYYEGPIVASRCPNAPEDVLQLGRIRAAELHEVTKPFILRRTQATINQYLPKKHDVVICCRMSKVQEEIYNLITSLWFKKEVVATSVIDKCVPHLTIITALKKVCNHPALLLNEENSLSQVGLNIPSELVTKINRMKNSEGKISVVKQLLHSLKSTDEKIVLVSYFTQTLNVLENLCSEENLQWLRLDGSTPTAARTKIVEQFNSKHHNSRVFLLSAKAGGVGLNLPGASRLVLFDSDWNPASDAQAMARIWRDGQTRTVYVYRLLTTGTIEEKIYQRQISKTGLGEAVIDSNPLASLKLSINELKDLFALNTETNSITHDSLNCTSCENWDSFLNDNDETMEPEHSRDVQFSLEKNNDQQNLTISQLLQWEHFEQPVPPAILQELMLEEVSQNITFLFKNSTLENNSK